MRLHALLAASALALACGLAQAAAIRSASEFTDFTLAGNDDGSTGLVNLGFSLNFYGLTRTQAYVNNNGNITFDAALGTYTPFGLSGTNRQILAPFFADVDTRNSNTVQYGTGTVDGRNAFGVNWIDVGYYSRQNNKLNSFQLILTDRSDTGAGNFDIEFNYDKVQWETGGASGGSNGLGGDSVRAGWSNGSSNSYEFAGSAVNGALLDGGANALVSGSLNANGLAGRYVFNVRDGVISNEVPEPGALALLGVALLAAGAARRRAR